MTRISYLFLFIALIAFSQIRAQQKDYYYENQTRYGTFRNYVNGGSKLISGTDYAADIAKSQEEARQMAAQRQRQRQIELERMRNSSNSNQTNTNYTPANDVRFETLKYPNGDTYIGNTLNAEPHGKGGTSVENVTSASGVGYRTVYKIETKYISHNYPEFRI